MTTTTDTTYNGWTNYSTWRINLENFADLTVCDITGDESLADFLEPHNGKTGSDIRALADAMREHLEEYIYDMTPDNLARSYALAFLSDVDWAQIARHKIEDALREELKDFAEV